MLTLLTIQRSVMIHNNIFILFLSKNHIRLFEGPISNLLSSRFERVNRPFLKSISELSK